MKKKALTPKAKHWLAVLLSAIVAISAAVPGTLTTAFAGENGTVDYSYNSGNEDGTDNGEDGTDNGEDGTDNGEGGIDNGEGGTDNGEDGTDNGEGGTDNGEGGTGSAVNGNIDFGAGIGDTQSNADDAEEIRIYVSDELKEYVKNQFTSALNYIAAIHLEYGDQHVTTTTLNLGGYYFTFSVPGGLNSDNCNSFFDGVTFLDGAASEKDHVYFSREDLKVTTEWEEGKGLFGKDWDTLTYRLDLGEEQENGANTTWVTYYANYENADPEYLQFSAEIGKTHQVLNYGETGLKARDNYKFQGWATTPNGQVELAYKEGNYIDIAGAVTLYAVWKEDDGQNSYTVTHKFADGTPAEVSFTGGQKEVSQNFENPAQKLKAQEITKGYVITKIEVWENSALKTEYKGNYEYMNTYLTKDVPVELVYHVEKKEDPDTSTPSEPDTSEPDDRYPPRPDPDDDDDETVIPDESTPLAPGTDDGTGAVVVPEGPGGDDTVIDDDDVPLASLPTEEIDGDETPVTNPPKTGVKTAGSVALLAGSLVAALATLKKRHSK